MMVMDPYPGFEGKSFSFPCRNVVPKPVQKPHPPMWMACTNRDTIKVAASQGSWRPRLLVRRSRRGAQLGRDLLRDHQVRGVRSHRPQRQRQHRHGLELLGPSRSRRSDPARTGRFRVLQLCRERARGARRACRAARPSMRTSSSARGNATKRSSAARQRAERSANGIGTPDDIREHIRAFQAAGVDQVIFLQQAGRNQHHISASRWSCSPPR